MCYRINVLTMSELKLALEELEATGHAHVAAPNPMAPAPDAYPGSRVALLLPASPGPYRAVELAWGFDAPASQGSKLVFNTRIETARAHARAGRGMWAEPILHGRCLVPVRGFFESWSTSRQAKPPQLRFTVPGRSVFLLAGVMQDDRFSIVTCEPNASVAPYHSRMPLVLAPGESGLWLGPDYARLGERSRIVLDAAPELSA